MRGNHIHGYKPFLQRNFGIVENSTLSDREVCQTIRTAVAAIAAFSAMMPTTQRANNIVTPSLLGKEILTCGIVLEICHQGYKTVKLREVKATRSIDGIGV